MSEEIRDAISNPDSAQAASAPNRIGRFDDQRQFCPFVGLGKRIASDSAGLQHPVKVASPSVRCVLGDALIKLLDFRQAVFSVLAQCYDHASDVTVRRK